MIWTKGNTFHLLMMRAAAVCLLLFVAAGCSKQAQKARYASKADKLYQAGDYSRAEIEYKRLLRLEPENYHTIRQLALIYYSQGRFGRAMAFLVTARSMNTNDLDVRVKYGYMLSAAGKAKEARDEALFVLERDPTHAEAPLLLVETVRATNDIPEIRGILERCGKRSGVTAAHLAALGSLSMRQGNMDDAESVLRRAIVLDPKSPAAHAALGSMYWIKGNTNQADVHYKTAAELEPVRSPKRLRYAEFKLMLGEIEQGRKLLEEMVEKAPDYLPAYHRLARIALEERKFDECASILRKVLIREESDFEALMLQGRMYLMQEKIPESVRAFTQLTDKFPKVPNAHYNLAIAHLLNRDLGKAIASLNEAVRLDPDYADAVLLLGELNLRKGDSAAAIGTIRQFLAKYPNHVPANLQLANAYLARRMTDEALGLYRHLATIMPTNPLPQMLMGRVLLSQQKPAEARQAFERAASLVPVDMTVIEQLVALDLAEQKYDQAHGRLRRLIERDPKTTAPQLLLARVYLAQGLTNRAEDVLRKTIEQDPSARGAHLLLARIAFDANKRSEALERLQDLLAKNPRDITALMHVAVVHESDGNYAAARDAYEKLLSVSTNSWFALNNLAYLYAERLGEVDRAHQLARRARELRPSDPAIADTLGWVLYKKGDYAQALQLFKESSEKLGSVAEIQFHLGAAHYRLGEEEMARLALERAIEFGGEFAGKNDAIGMLATINVDPKNAGEREISHLVKALDDHPADIIAALKLASIYELKGRPEKAIEILNRAVKANPNSAVLIAKIAEVYLNRLHDAKTGLEQARAAWKLAGDDPYIAQRLGRVAAKAGDRDWALKLFQASARLRPNDPEVLCDLAQAYYEVGEVEQAEANLRIALRSSTDFPGTSEARQLLRFIEYAGDARRAEQAATEIDSVLKARPQWLPALMAAGVVHEHRGNKAGAIGAYEAALGLNPGFKPALRKLAVLRGQDTQDLNKAYDLALKAREAYPNDPIVAKTLGILAYRRGEYGRSAHLLKEASTKLPNDAEVVYYQGLARYRLNEKSESKQLLQKALAMNPQSPLVVEATNALEKLK